MNTDILTTPSPELKQHAQDLRRDAGNVTEDLKRQASAGFEEVKKEAHARLQETKGAALDLYDAFRNFVAEHPFKAFGIGVVTGIVLANWRRN
jgi:ElaB/YqjD/DUF883 family membrane-anchored ribosome-binding protein